MRHRSTPELAANLTRAGWHLALLPVGCFEQHGPELPLATDCLQAEELTRRLTARLESSGQGWAYELPTIAYTPTEPNKNYPGTVSVPGDVFRPYLESVLRGVLRTAYTGVIVVNSHGSVEGILKEVGFKLVLEQFESQVRPVRPILCLNTYDLSVEARTAFDQPPGRHADWTELLMTLEILGRNYFDAQRLERLQEFSRAHDFATKMPGVLGIPAELRTVQGVQGSPWPKSQEPLDQLASQYWNLVETACHEILLRELSCFEAKYAQASQTLAD